MDFPLSILLFILYSDKDPVLHGGPGQFLGLTFQMSVFLMIGRRPSRLSSHLELCVYRACAGGDSLVPGVPAVQRGQQLVHLYFIPSVGSFSSFFEGFFRPTLIGTSEICPGVIAASFECPWGWVQYKPGG